MRNLARKQRGVIIQLGIGGAILAVVIIVLITIAVYEVIKTASNDEDDDKARARITFASCDQIQALPNTHWKLEIEKLLDGPTGDDDEIAIIKVFECLPCDRATELLNTLGRNRVLDDIHGVEWDRMMVRLEQCGLANLSELDDDATRSLINARSCAQLTGYSVDALNQLVKNLFEGDTGDADERAINKLIGCLPCSTRKELMKKSGTHFEDFDSEVHGDEWDVLEPLLKC